MMIHPALIGFDIDGVVADTMEAFLRLARDDHGINTISAEDITEFEVEDCLDVDLSVVENIFQRLMKEPVAAGLRPMRYAVEVLREFAGVAPLHFVTARPQKDPIEEWLRQELGPAAFRQTRLIAMGKHDNKAQYVKNLGLRYFIDDRAQTCIDLSSEGITSMVYSQPWNRGKHNLATVRDWLDIRLLCFD
jgi:uncharacterized HAD superfamily protein